MKLLNWMFVAALSLGFAACSNNDGIENGANEGTNLEEGTTYAALTLNFDNKTASRANTEGDYDDNGTDEENKVTSLRLIVVSGDAVEYNEQVDLSKLTTIWKKEAFTIKLTPGKKSFYAIINEDVAFSGTTAADLKTYLTTAVTSGVTSIASDNKFMMVNVDEVVGYMQNNVTADEAAKGKNNVSILVDRVSAKVEVKAASVTYKNDDHVAAGAIEFTLGNADLTATTGYTTTGFYRMQQHNAESTTWSTPYTDFIPAKDAAHTVPTDYAALGVKYCLENVHTSGTTAETSKYKQGNTTYAAIRVPVLVKEKANLTYANNKLTVGTVTTVANPTSVAFYFVNAAQAPYNDLLGQYILSSDMETLGESMGETGNVAAKKAKAIEVLNGLGINVSAEYTDGYAYFKSWVNVDSNPYVSPVFRNNWYELTINSITFPGDPQKPTIVVDDPLKVENNAQITVNIRNWNLVQHTIDLE